MQENNLPVSFDNTELAFKYKSDKELKQAKFLFTVMGKPLLVKLGTRMTPWAIRSGLPVKGLVRNTIFKQFVGGETLEETAKVAEKLGRYHVKVILVYGGKWAISPAGIQGRGMAWNCGRNDTKS